MWLIASALAFNCAAEWQLCAHLQPLKAPAGSPTSGPCISKIDMADLLDDPDSPVLQTSGLHRTFVHTSEEGNFAPNAGVSQKTVLLDFVIFAFGIRSDSLAKLVGVKAVIASGCVYGGQVYVSTVHGTNQAIPSLVYNCKCVYAFQ